MALFVRHVLLALAHWRFLALAALFLLTVKAQQAESIVDSS
jgi:hypothetical protein